MLRLKYEVHGTRDNQVFYDIVYAVSNPDPDPHAAPLLVTAFGKTISIWSLGQAYRKIRDLYEANGVQDVKVSDSRI